MIEKTTLEILLKYGFIGIGALLMVLSYSSIRKVLSKATNQSVYKLIRLFLIFSTFLILSSFIFQLSEAVKNPSVTVEVDPTDPELWKNNEKYYRWYNAQYALAKGDFLNNNVIKIRDKGVKYELLLFPGQNDVGNQDFKGKFERMRDFVIAIHREVDVHGKVFVKLSRSKSIPSISFFNSKKDGEDATIYYIQSLVKDNGIPKVAFQTAHDIIVEYFDDTFQKEWREARFMDIDSLLDQSLTTAEFFD